MGEKRGQKHNWHMQNVWGEVTPRCIRCGLLGTVETVSTDRAMGWRVKPTYGCTPTDTKPAGEGE